MSPRTLATSPSDRLDYPTLERAVRTIQDAGREPHMGMAVRINATRDMARQGVLLHIFGHQRNDMYGAVASVENITWRVTAPGEEAPPSQPFFLGEREARMLAEELSEFHPDVRRLASARAQLQETQSELRSLSNQLEEVRAHNRTLVGTNQETQRQVRWLERELRDANVERRESD